MVGDTWPQTLSSNDNSPEIMLSGSLMKEVKEITSGSLWENSPDGDETCEAMTERTNTFFFNFPSFVLQRREYPSWKYGMLYINYAASGLKNIKASNFLSDLKFCKRLITFSTHRTLHTVPGGKSATSSAPQRSSQIVSI